MKAQGSVRAGRGFRGGLLAPSLLLAGVLSLPACHTTGSQNERQREVIVQNTQATSLENMLDKNARSSTIEPWVMVLGVAFLRTDRDEAVHQVEMSCQVGDVPLIARLVDYGAADARYNAYLYTTATASKRLPTGEAELRCSVLLDGEAHALTTTAYFAGPPLGTPFELLDPALQAFHCDTGAQPVAGEPVCVRFYVRNPNRSVAVPAEEVNMTCSLGDQNQSEKKTVGSLSLVPYIETRFDSAPKAGEYTLGCGLFGEDNLPEARSTVAIRASAGTTAIEASSDGVLQKGNEMPSGEYHGPRTHWNLAVDVRVSGEEPLWKVEARCQSKTSSLVLAGGYHAHTPPTRALSDASSHLPRTLAPGSQENITLLVTLPADKQPDKGAFDCTVEALTRDGSKILAEDTFTVEVR